ncbi:GFA family protein [Bradyrhizobium sp. 2TAF24]|uniref:GFA family protein n=1 Tax=Bradyrhizobium sp. 2TAF24 TaxID=3233011 RepID=UPI003F934D8E
MTGWNDSHDGGCRCGRLRFAVKGARLMTMACHCTGCQRMTASAFSLSALYPSAAFTVTAGEPVIGGLHGPTRHFFCDYCMSWLFTRPEGMGDFVNVRATMLDDARSFHPFIETYICEKLPWATTSAVHSFDKYPAMEQFPALLAEYREQSR